MRKKMRGCHLVLMAWALLWIMGCFSVSAAAGEPGVISFNATGGIAEAATEYDLQKDTNGVFSVQYQPVSSGTTDVVLVIRCMEYGAAVAELPRSDTPGVAEAVRLDSQTMAIRLENGRTEKFLLDVKLMSVALTAEQAAAWIDSPDGKLPDTSFSVTEYSLSDSAGLSSVLSSGTELQSVAACTVTPKRYAAKDLKALNTYQATVSSVATICNDMLSKVGISQHSSDSGVFNPHKNGELRYEIPTVHSDENGLMEVTGIKVYCPDEKLKLTAVGKISSINVGNASVLLTSDFDEMWADWIVGERQTEEEGANAGKSYYIITPNKRWFNIASGTDLAMNRYGMHLTWQLVDTAEELGYLSDDYKVFQAPDTQLLYRTVGSTDVQAFSHIGPIIETFARVIDPEFKHAFSYTNIINNEKITEAATEASYTRGIFTNTANTWYYEDVKKNSSTVSDAEYIRKEHSPAYTGPVTQSFDFPLEINPTAMIIGAAEDWGYGGATGTYDREHIHLDALTYKLANGTLIEADEDELLAINAVLQSPESYSSYTYTLSKASPDNPATNITLSWDAFANTWRLGHPTTAPVSGLETNNSSDNYTVCLRFDYDVAAYHDLAKENPICSNDRTKIRYRLSTGGTDSQAEFTSQDGDPYLNIVLLTPSCPTLDAHGASRSALADDVSEGLIGSLRLNLGNGYGERKQHMLNPAIDIRASLTSWTRRSDDPVNNTLLGITDEQTTVLLTGTFTAMPALSGWKVAYTTKNGISDTLTIPEITGRDGQKFVIPLAEGDFLESLRIYYEGEWDITRYDAYRETIFSTQYLSLIKDIVIRGLTTNPYTGEALSASKFAGSAYVFLKASLCADDCTCEDHQHDAAQVPGGQKATALTSPYAESTLWFNRTISLQRWDSYIPSGTVTAYQGGNLNAVFESMIHFYVSPNTEYVSESNRAGIVPWDISETVYAELTDPEILIDYDQTYLFGVPATSPNVLCEEITVDGKRFLKMKFADGYVREWRYIWDYDEHKSLKDASNDRYGFQVVKGCYAYETSVATNVSGPIQLGFRVLPGAQVKTHYPLGKIYLDLSELLDKYNAPEKTGYDRNVTNYVISSYYKDGFGGVPDTLGISESKATDEIKLFEFDASGYAIKVVRGTYIGGMLAPGRNESLYDFASYRTVFQPAERNNLNSLLTIINREELFRTSTLVKIPRKDSPIRYSDGNGGTQTSASEFDMYLRSAPVVLSASDELDLSPGNLKIEYTTDTDPSESSSFFTEAPTDAEGWRRITGIRVSLNRMPMDSSISIKLALSADSKVKVGTEEAYSGGSFYGELEGEDGIVPITQMLNRVIWAYEDYPAARGVVFWDTEDENGLRGTPAAGAFFYEPMSEGVQVELYAPDGTTRIDSAVTGTDGSFELHTTGLEAGQIVKVVLPSKTDTEVSGGAEVRLTAKSSADFGASKDDSDFDRETGLLVLPAIPAKGFSNISAGLIRLPELSAADMTLYVGESGTAHAVLTDYYNQSLPEDCYNLSFSAAEDSNVAAVTQATVVLTGKNEGQSGETAVLALAAGTTTATVKTYNRLGDEVSASYRITVSNYPAGSLKISKLVTAGEGLTAPADAVFRFAVSFDKAAGDDVCYTVTDSSGKTSSEMAWPADGIISLKAGETANVLNIAAGTSYSVSEQNLPAGFRQLSPETNPSGTIVKDQVSSAEFTNCYEIDDITLSFPVKKVVNVPEGLIGPKDWNYRIIVSAEEGAPTADIMQIEVNKRSDTAVFGPFIFTRPGTYLYTVTESGSAAGVINDSEATSGKTVTVTVTDNEDGTLTAVADSTEESPLTFTNRYEAGTVELSFPVKKVMNVPEDLKGPADWTFLITASAEQDAPAADSMQAELSRDHNTAIFGPFTFAQAGTFRYTVTESGSVAGVTNDEEAESGKTVTVTVTDNGDGTMTAAADYNEASPLMFVNSYGAEPLTISIGITKRLESPDKAAAPDISKAFRFVIEDDPSDEIASPLPDRTELFNPSADGGSACFGTVVYNKPGTYVYLISESGSMIGVKNDAASEKKLTVSVTDNGAGKLQAVLIGANPDDGSVGFINFYEVGALTVANSVTGSAGEPNRGFHFSIKLDQTISGTFGSIVFSNGQAELVLKGGESVTIENLPAGITYSVTGEDCAAEGYKMFSKGNEGQIVSGKERLASFGYSKDEVPETEEQPSETEEENNGNSGLPGQTGDNSSWLLWSCLLVCSGLGMMISLSAGRRKNRVK